MPSKSTYYLMWVSLTILGIFLGYWLKEGYQDTKESMQDKNVFLFNQAVRATEDSLLQLNFRFDDMPMMGKDTAIEIHINLDTFQRRRVIFDHFSADSVFQKGTFSFGGDSAKMQKLGFIEHKNENDLISSAAIIVRSLPGGISASSLDTFLIQQIEKNYKRAKDIEFPHISYSMIHVIDTIQGIDKEWITPAFFDPVGNVRYAAVLDADFLDIFRKIWPQFLFSLFLFGITGYAFFLIHHSLKRQFELVQLKDDFIGNMTHELKTPISTVSVALEALESFNGLENPQRTKEYLTISKKELKRLQMLVDQIMNTGAIESPDFALHLEKVDIEEISRDVISAFQIKLDHEKMKLNFNSVGNNMILADRLHLTNVMYNLIDNAIKYRNSSEIIDINIFNVNDQVTWQIQDYGIGIPKENQSRIFDKFYRVPQGNQHNVKGHGLGLHYVGRIMNLHGGQVKLDSKYGAGSKFILSFPTITD